MKRAGTARIYLGGTVNLCLSSVVIIWLSGAYMDLAASVLNQRVAWPQIAFMSAYPSDVRNGYLLFVAAVLTVIFLNGVLASILGASPGKALIGLKYLRDTGTAAKSYMIGRAGLQCLLLLPMLLAGPVLGFVFGAAADPFSMIALILGIALIGVATCWSQPGGLSWVNRRIGVTPTLRRDTAS